MAKNCKIKGDEKTMSYYQRPISVNASMEMKDANGSSKSSFAKGFAQGFGMGGVNFRDHFMKIGGIEKAFILSKSQKHSF